MKRSEVKGSAQGHTAWNKGLVSQLRAHSVLSAHAWVRRLHFVLSATWQPGKVSRQKGKGVLGSLGTIRMGWERQGGGQGAWGRMALGASSWMHSYPHAGSSACILPLRPHLLSFAASSSRSQGLAFLRASARILPCSLSERQV